MSYIKIQNKLSGDNKGSSNKAVKYLEKENKILAKLDKPAEMFFNQKRLDVWTKDVVKNLDSKRTGLKKRQDKFFSITFSPSKEELEKLSDLDLKNITQDIMKKYASNFNRDIDPNDLVWYAKLEHTRKRKGYKLTPGEKSGEFKPGDNRHIHILVRRNTKKGVSLSPMANARNSKSFGDKNIQVGFDRLKFAILSENIVRNKIKSKGIEHNPKLLMQTHFNSFKKRHSNLSKIDFFNKLERIPIYKSYAITQKSKLKSNKKPIEKTKLQLEIEAKVKKNKQIDFTRKPKSKRKGRGI